MERQNELRSIGDQQATVGLDPRRLEAVDLFQQRRRRDHHAVTEHTLLFRVKDPGWDQVEREVPIGELHRMAGVMPALEANDGVETGTNQVDDLALTFVAPLKTDDDGVRHLPALRHNEARKGTTRSSPARSARNLPDATTRTSS